MEASGVADVGATHDRRALRPSGGRPAAEEQVPQQVDRIGQVDVLIPVRIEEEHVPCIDDGASLAGEDVGGPQEEVPEKADRVRDVECAVLRAVAGELRLSGPTLVTTKQASTPFSRPVTVNVVSVTRPSLSLVRSPGLVL
jgi:hypothetical protein